MKKGHTIEKTFIRRTYQKENTSMISIPIEIARKLEIDSNTSFVTQLIDGMIIYKPIDTRVSSKRIPKNIEEQQGEDNSKEITIRSSSSPPQQHQGSIKENNDDSQELLKIVEESKEIINDADIDVTGAEEI